MRYLVPCLLLFFCLCSAAQAAGEKFDPVIIYQGSIEGNSFNVSVKRGVDKFVQETGEDCLELVLGTDQKKFVKSVEKIADQGHSPIFLLYGNHFPELVQLARAHPTTRFIVLDAVKDEPNMYSFTFAEHEGSFLAGMLAAMASKSGIIGFVSVNDIPIMRRFWCGYVQGARYVDPSIAVLDGFLGQYPGSWFDSEAAARLAGKMMDQGADVIYQAAGGAGPAVLEAAAERGRLGIGVDVNQNGLFPGHVLTSMVKHTDRSVYAALKLARRGVWRDNLKRLGLAQDAVGVVFDGNNALLVTPEMRERVEQARRDIITGSIVVHDYVTDLSCP